MLGHGYLPVTFEIAALAAMVVIIIVDLLLVVKRPHVPSFKECALWVAFYVGLAIIFGGVIYLVADPPHQSEVMFQFYAGWLTEYSLSIDNLFIFVIILASFRVPAKVQQEVLMVGIIIALVLRAVMIVVGSAVIERYAWVFYLFGAFLIWTAIKLIRDAGHDDEDDEYKENVLIRVAKRFLPVTDEWNANKVTVRIDGKRYFTPLLMVILALGTTDLMFALDSIPAIFGISQDPFVVFATNLFALMGLRQLYFLLGGLLDRLVYLPYGLSFILAFIGVKLVLHAMHENDVSWINGGEPFHVPEISSLMSLGVIVVTLVVTTVLSLTVGRRGQEAPAGGHAGKVPTDDPGVLDSIDKSGLSHHRDPRHYADAADGAAGDEGSR